MKRAVLCVTGIFLVGTAVLVARPRQAAPAGGGQGLEGLAWLVGTWRADATAPDGAAATNEFRFERAPHGKAFHYAIHQTSRGLTTPRVVGLCAWHPVKQRFSLWEVDAAGAVTEGTLEIAGQAHSYEETIYSPDGSTLPVRAEAVRDGQDTFQFKARIEQGGEWKVVFQATWRRVKS
jgi:hypothetical protein